MTGQQLVDRWIAFVRKYVAMTDGQALVVALWAMTTWVQERYTVKPYLEIVAPAKRSGKTRVLDVLTLLSRNAQPNATLRVLSMCRIIGALEQRCTFLFDEMEVLWSASLGDTRQILASGYRNGAFHTVIVGGKAMRFPVACMKAFALIGNVQDVIRDRCIELELSRSKPERQLPEWQDEAEAEAVELVEALRVYSGRLDRWPVVPADWLHNREREIWTPLYSVATALGLHADAMRTFQAISVDLGQIKLQPAKRYDALQDATTDADELEAAERVLRDAVTVFQPGETFVPSTELVNRLRGIHTSPWRSWRLHGLNEIHVSALLDRFGVAPEVGQIGKGRKERKQVRGYKLTSIRSGLTKLEGAGK